MEMFFEELASLDDKFCPLLVAPPTRRHTSCRYSSSFTLLALGTSPLADGACFGQESGGRGPRQARLAADQDPGPAPRLVRVSGYYIRTETSRDFFSEWVCCSGVVVGFACAPFLR